MPSSAPGRKPPTSRRPVERFGTLGRNVIIGAGFNNLDFSVLKNIKLDEKMRLNSVQKSSTCLITLISDSLEVW